MKIQVVIVILILTVAYAKNGEKDKKRHKKFAKAYPVPKSNQKTIAVVKGNAKEGSGQPPLEEFSGEGSARAPQDDQATPPPIGGSDFEPGPANTPAPLGPTAGSPTPEVEQPGEVATTPNPDANVASVNLIQFNPVLTPEHSSGNGCYSAFNYQFNTAQTVAERNQQYIVLRECLRDKCDLSKCNDDQTKCMQTAGNDENKIYECNYYWFGCANEKCSPAL